MLRASAPLCSSRKLALRFFRAEQQKNASLCDLSAAQKKKVILKMFRELSASDMETLKVKAAVWEAKATGGDGIAPPSRGKRREVTPYELFFREQSSNPAIASISSPSVREKKLFAIYNSLPDVTKEALERRAREMSEGRAVGAPPPVAVKKRPAVKKPKKNKKSQTSRKTSTAKAKEKKRPERNESSKKSVVSPYAAFVKEQMAHVKHLPPKERMKVIAEKWRALKTEGAGEASVPVGITATDPPASL